MLLLIQLISCYMCLMYFSNYVSINSCCYLLHVLNLGNLHCCIFITCLLHKFNHCVCTLSYYVPKIIVNSVGVWFWRWGSITSTLSISLFFCLIICLFNCVCMLHFWCFDILLLYSLPVSPCVTATRFNIYIYMQTIFSAVLDFTDRLSSFHFIICSFVGLFCQKCVQNMMFSSEMYVWKTFLFLYLRYVLSSK